MIFEKDKLIQDAQYKSREILLERQSVEDRISNEYKRLNELVDKYVFNINFKRKFSVCFFFFSIEIVFLKKN